IVFGVYMEIGKTIRGRAFLEIGVNSLDPDPRLQAGKNAVGEPDDRCVQLAPAVVRQVLNETELELQRAEIDRGRVVDDERPAGERRRGRQQKGRDERGRKRPCAHSEGRQSMIFGSADSCPLINRTPTARLKRATQPPTTRSAAVLRLAKRKPERVAIATS